jgi:hypothetical protein
MRITNLPERIGESEDQEYCDHRQKAFAALIGVALSVLQCRGLPSFGESIR